MPNFLIVDNENIIKTDDRWTGSVKFNSKNKIVGNNGKPIGSNYKGRQFKLISKKEKKFSFTLRVTRVFFGTVTVILTVGFALFFKSVRNLFTKVSATVRYAVPVPAPEVPQVPLTPIPKHVPIPDLKKEEYSKSEQELQEGVIISNELVSKIQASMKSIYGGKEENGIKQYKCQHNHLVFSLESYPEYIFKMNVREIIVGGKDTSMKERYRAMVNAQTVCRTHQLGLLVIPNAKLFTVRYNDKDFDIIAEKKMDINPSQSIQEQYYDDYAASLNETIRQLALFICKTGYNDVEWRNIPILNNSLNALGQRKIALIDLEDMESNLTGLFGGGLRIRGLVRCVNEEQGKIIEKVAQENGLSTNLFAKAYEKRRKEIEIGTKLKEFYSKKNIVTGFEPLNVDLNALGLNMKELEEIEEIVVENGIKIRAEDGKYLYKKRSITMEKATIDVIEEINKLIQERPQEHSVKEKRKIILNPRVEPFTTYEGLGLPSDDYRPDMTIEECEEYYKKWDEILKKRWLLRIVNALVEKGYLFELTEINGYGGYCIQA